MLNIINLTSNNGIQECYYIPLLTTYYRIYRTQAGGIMSRPPVVMVIISLLYDLTYMIIRRVHYSILIISCIPSYLSYNPS